MRDRQAGRTGGGGVAIYAASTLQLRDISPDADDIAAVELNINGERMAVVTYYVPPFVDIDPTLLDPLLTTYPAALLFGDLNARHQYFGCRRTDRAGELLFNLAEQYDLTVLNNPEQPSHYGPIGEPEILDYALATSRSSRFVTSCNTWDDVGSDHLPLKVELQLTADVRRYPVVLQRAMSKCDWPTFSSTLDQHISTNDDDIQLYSQTAIDGRGEELVGAINTALDIACPKRPIKPGAFRVTKKTLQLIKLKRKVRKQQQDTNEPLLKTAYNNLNRRVKTAVAKEKREAWLRATEELNHLQGAKLWKKFNSLTGGGKGNSITKKLVDSNDTTHSGDPDVAEAFADHLEAVHITHQGPEYCQATKDIIEEDIASNTHLYTPCFRPAVGEPGDDHLLAEPIHADDVQVD